MILSMKPKKQIERLALFRHRTKLIYTKHYTNLNSKLPDHLLKNYKFSSQEHIGFRASFL